LRRLPVVIGRLDGVVKVVAQMGTIDVLKQFGKQKPSSESRSASSLTCL
jgi:hypothetical protein